MVLSAEDCSSTPWNRPWEPVRSCHASKMRRWGPWARSADLAGRPAWPGLQPPPILTFGLSWCPLSQAHGAWPVQRLFAWVFGLVLIHFSLNLML